MRRTLALLLLAGISVVVLAAPAYPGPYDLTLEDGSTLLSGSRYVDEQGRNIYLDEDGTPSYFEPSGEPGAPLRSRRQALEQAENSPASMPAEWEAQARQRRARFNEALALSAAKRSKARSTEPVVFVLVQYPDYASGSGITEHIQSVVFNASGNGDTINSYYYAQSNGAFQFTQAAETSGTANDGVIGPVTVNCSWVNQSGWGTAPDYTCIQTKGLMAAAPYLDLKSFDLDNDDWINGTELHVVLIIAGGDTAGLTTAGMKNCPHVWGFMQPGAGFKLTAQNVTFGEHVVTGENWGDCTVPFKIGVLAHELAHTLTVPDLYDTTGGLSILGPWCLMDAGNWNNGGKNPGMMSAFVRSYLGWATPTVVSSSSTDSLEIEPAGTNPDSILQFGSNPNGIDWEWLINSGTGEYFLVENRQNVGCDKYTKGHGVLVWHINEAASAVSNTAGALTMIERLQRKNQKTLSSGNYSDDVLTSSTRASMYCNSNHTPNSLLDNDSTSCVSLSATVNTTSLNAVVEPWTDDECGSCVYGQGGLTTPTTQYSFFEQFGFSLVSMDSATALTFTSTLTTVTLPWTFTFGGIEYTEAIVSSKGWINFVSANTGTYGTGKYPVIAAFAGPTATAVTTLSFTCAAPFQSSECFAVQWTQGKLTTQAVLAASGNIYLVWSGNKTGLTASTYISTGSAGAVTYPGGLWQVWDWTSPLASPAAMLATPRAKGLLSLPFTDSFEDALPSSTIWSHVTCGAIGTTCGSSTGTALTFNSPIYLNRNAQTYGIDVSGCSQVSVALVLGPSEATGNCTPVSGGTWFGPMYGTLSVSSWSWVSAGASTTLLDVSDSVSTLYLSWNWMNGEGMYYIDDLNVTCAVARATAAASSTTTAASTAASSATTAASTASSAAAAAASSAEESGAQRTGAVAAAWLALAACWAAAL
eukprot:m51a1_g946 hypothetical protein (927) ;mRNA; f:270647-273809